VTAPLPSRFDETSQTTSFGIGMDVRIIAGGAPGNGIWGRSRTERLRHAVEALAAH
jgi:hypothetical protein